MSFVYDLVNVMWHTPGTFGYDLFFRRNHNEPAFDRTVNNIHFYSKDLPVYPNPSADYMGAIALDTFYRSNYVSSQTFGQYVDCLADIPDVTTQYSLKVGSRSESSDVQTSIDFASEAFYRGGGISDGTPSIVLPGSWSGTPAGTRYGGVGISQTRMGLYQQIANDFDINIALTSPLRITKYSGTISSSHDFVWQYFIHTTSQSADLNFLNDYIGKTKIIVEFS